LGYYCASKEKKIERKKVNQSKRKVEKEKNRKEKINTERFFEPRQCLNNVQHCQKQKEEK